MIGTVKQQCVDSAGHYVWQKKVVQLDEKESFIQIHETEPSSQSDRPKALSLVGAKEAKEWSFSSPIAGYGFDIVWSSGAVTSFLVENEAACASWVNGINLAIENGKALQGSGNVHSSSSNYSNNVASGHTNGSVAAPCAAAQRSELGREALGESIAMPPSSAAEASHSFSQIPSSTPNMASFAYSDMPRTLPPSFFAANLATQFEEHKGGVLDETIRLPPLPAQLASAQFAGRSRYADTAVDEWAQPSGIALGGASPSIDFGGGSAGGTGGGRSAYIESMKSIFASTKQHLQQTESELSRARPSESIEPNRPLLPPRPALHEFPSPDHEARLAELSREVETLRARERHLLQHMNKEVEARVLRASNENSSFFDASSRAMRLQHQREMQSLQEELTMERERATAALEKEAHQRRRAQEGEEAQRKEAQLRSDRIVSLEIEVQHLRESLESERKAWQRERKKLTAEYEGKVCALTKERDEGLDELRKQFQDRAQEMHAKYDASLSALRAQEAEILRQQWESEKTRMLVEFHKQSQKELETIRAEERRLAAAEIESVRRAFQSRERQTASDLLELEQLHGSRVKQLEDDVEKERALHQKTKEDLAAAALQLERLKQSSEHSTSDWKKRMHEHVLRNDHLERELASALKSMDEARNSEKASREQARQAVADLRLLQAEVAELRRQTSEHAMSATQWRKVVSEQEQAVSTSSTAARIAREEVQLLEHELARLKHENGDLQAALQKAERLIFGVPQSTPMRQTYPMVVDSRGAPPTVYSTGLGTQLPVSSSPAIQTSKSQSGTSKAWRDR